MACGRLPSELVDYTGSRLERLLFDAAILQEEEESEPKTTLDAIIRRRRQSGGYA